MPLNPCLRKLFGECVPPKRGNKPKRRKRSDSGKGNARDPQGVGGGRFLDRRNVPHLPSNQSKLEQDWGLQE